MVPNIFHFMEVFRPVFVFSCFFFQYVRRAYHFLDNMVDAHSSCVRDEGGFTVHVQWLLRFIGLVLGLGYMNYRLMSTMLSKKRIGTLFFSSNRERASTRRNRCYCCCFLTLTLVKNLESVVTQRCWSPRKIRKTK